MSRMKSYRYEDVVQLDLYKDRMNYMYMLSQTNVNREQVELVKWLLCFEGLIVGDPMDNFERYVKLGLKLKPSYSFFLEWNKN